MRFFVVQCLIVSTQLSVGANFGVKGHHKNKKNFSFSTFLDECGHFFIHIDSPQKSLANDVQVLSFRCVKKNYYAKEPKKSHFL